MAPELDLAAAGERLAVLGPLTKQRIGHGSRSQEAIDGAFWQIAGGFYRDYLAPGRDLIDASTLAHPASVGWRRVTDTNPCAFCAMLATRGPAFTSPTNAGEGRRFHAHCGCTVEEVFGTWEPDEREQRMIDLYQQSAGGSTKDVLASMRANGQGLIYDAHVPEDQKTKPGPKPGGGGDGPPTMAGGKGGQPPPPRQSSGALGPDETPEERFHRAQPQVTERLRRHVLDGDKSGGGHRYTTRKSGKTVFPESWDDDRIIEAIDRVMRAPRLVQARGPFLVAIGEVDRVRIEVRLKLCSDEILTAHPIDGDGVARTKLVGGVLVRRPVPYGRVPVIDW